MTSIKDVATRAGVSLTTVSHTISGKRHVSANIKLRVEQAMDDLGYTPRRAAQSLASGRSRLIGLIVPDINNGFFSELASGVERAAIARDYNVVLCTTGSDHTREMFYLETVRSRALDGVVYAAGAPPTDSELNRLLGDLPVTLVDEDVKGSTAPAFVSDNYDGGRLAAEHLLSLGHTAAVVLTAADLESSSQRSRGFREAWEAAQLPSPRVALGAFTAAGGRAAIEQVLGALMAGESSAVFAVNDLMALGAIERLDEAGLRTPEDISIVGFDDTFIARYSRPKLTTVHQDVIALGEKAATALIDSLDGIRQLMPAERHVLPVQLVVRSSTAAPPHMPRIRKD